MKKEKLDLLRALVNKIENMVNYGYDFDEIEVGMATDSNNEIVAKLKIKEYNWERGGDEDGER